MTDKDLWNLIPNVEKIVVPFKSDSKLLNHKRPSQQIIKNVEDGDIYEFIEKNDRAKNFFLVVPTFDFLELSADYEALLDLLVSLKGKVMLVVPDDDIFHKLNQRFLNNWFVEDLDKSRRLFINYEPAKQISLLN